MPSSLACEDGILRKIEGGINLSLTQSDSSPEMALPCVWAVPSHRSLHVCPWKEAAVRRPRSETLGAFPTMCALGFMGKLLVTEFSTRQCTSGF